jgi:TetR/AcrR family transcriptional regulator, lmrAB and yxaGH operons repressor
VTQNRVEEGMARGDHRDAMIRTTKELLQSQGYPGTGLNQILKECGAPKGSMYHYFPGGKEELGAAALALAAEEIRSRMSALEGLAPAEAIARSGELLGRELLASDYGAGSPIATVALEMSSESEVLRQACVQAYDTWLAMFTHNLTAAGVSDEVARAASLVTLSAMEGALLLCRVHRSLEPLCRVTEAFTLMAAQLGPDMPEPPAIDGRWPGKATASEPE